MSPVGKLTPVVARAEEVRAMPVGKLTPVKKAAPVGLLVPVSTVGADSKQEEPLQAKVVEHIKLREGVVNKSYNDRGQLAGGVGHLLTQEEQALYPEGSHIPQEVVDSWLKADIAKASKAAQKQAQELGEDDEGLVLALTSVNFQLGTSWNKEHKDTWKLMKEGRYKEAAEEAARSKWQEQTPTRVEDFQNALRNL